MSEEITQKCGNAAALRKALENLIEALEDVGFVPWSAGDPLAYAFGQANAALAAPPRNCDVGTVVEQLDRHREYCVAGVLCTYACTSCFAEWAQMPYGDKPTTNHEPRTTKNRRNPNE